MDLKEIKRLAEEGHSIGEIAEKLGVPVADLQKAFKSIIKELKKNKEERAELKEYFSPAILSESRLEKLQASLDDVEQRLQLDSEAVTELLEAARAYLLNGVVEYDAFWKLISSKVLLSHLDFAKMHELKIKLLDQIAKETHHYKQEPPKNDESNIKWYRGWTPDEL
jgi:IS30 family transposase